MAITPKQVSLSRVLLGEKYRLEYYPNLRGFVLQKRINFFGFIPSWIEEGTDNVYFSNVNDGVSYFNCFFTI